MSRFGYDVAVACWIYPNILPPGRRFTAPTSVALRAGNCHNYAMKPVVSVLHPDYNGEACLKPAEKSVLSQTWNRFFHRADKNRNRPDILSLSPSAAVLNQVGSQEFPRRQAGIDAEAVMATLRRIF